MKYPIKKEFGLCAHFHPPVCKALLPLINYVLSLLPKKKQSGITESKLHIPSEAGRSVDALLLTPDGIGDNAPCLVYYHGGGFVMEAAPSHYALMTEYAKGARCKVLFVRYRLAPKYAFPVPVLDCFSAYQWVLQNADALGVDPGRIAVGGDSAGGCLAAAICLMARDRGVPLPCFQMLIYPLLDRRMQTASMRLYPDTPMWNARLNEKMWQWYLPEQTTLDVAYASPAEAATLAGLPDAYLETAEFDCLRDEGIAYADALQNAGCAVERNDTSGTMHGFDGVLHSPTVRACIEQRIGALQRAFDSPVQP
ncbi:MAG: alpha/beta hydrolase [Eubacteriales bacterium]|nr:alpha/beta hydrolase [Eubacteriales bacterium]